MLLDGKVNDLNKSIQRNSSMDLLKIIAIYLVVLTHSATKSKFTFLDGYSAARIEVQMCELGGFADGLFFMISGYFLILSKSTTLIDIKKCLRIIIKSADYSGAAKPPVR